MNSRILTIRKELGLSQEKFGEKLGVTGAGISKIESGNRGITDQMIKAICREFYVNEEWLTEGKGDMFRTEDDLYKVLVDNLDTLDDMDRKMLMEYLQLTPSHRQIFKDFIIKVASDNNSEVAATIDTSIDEELESYRLELEAEKKGITSSVSGDIEGVRRRARKVN